MDGTLMTHRMGCKPGLGDRRAPVTVQAGTRSHTGGKCVASGFCFKTRQKLALCRGYETIRGGEGFTSLSA